MATPAAALCYKHGMGIFASDAGTRTRLRARLARLGLLSLLLMGCGDDAGSMPDGGGIEGDAAGAARVELGTGNSGFISIPADAPTLELVAGTQGLWHVEATVRFWDLEPDQLTLEYFATPVGASAPVNVPAAYRLTRARVVPEGDHWLRLGDLIVFDITMPSDVVGRDVELVVRMTEPGGRSAEDRRVVRILDAL